MQHIWTWFLELHAGRQIGMGGVSPLSHTDIAAWASLAGVWPTPWEALAIRALDATFLKAWADAQPKTPTKGGP